MTALELNIIILEHSLERKNVTRNIYRIQAYYSIMWGYFCMLKGKSFFDYRNLFYPNDYEKNDKKNTKIFSIGSK